MSYWSVVHVESQCAHVVRLLLMRARFETYMPQIKTERRTAPLFPGYLFVRIVERWYPVMWTPGVVRLLMSGDQPARLPEKIVDDIRKRQGRDGFVKLPANGLQKGQQVRIIRGSFEGQIALCDGMSGKDRVRILLELLGQVVPIELPGKDIQPIADQRRLRY